MINLSASPTLGCGINTGKCLFITTQHPNIWFSVSHGHTLLFTLHPRCLSDAFAASKGRLLPAKGTKEILPVRFVINRLGLLAIPRLDAQGYFFLDIWSSTLTLFCTTHLSIHFYSCTQIFLHRCVPMNMHLCIYVCLSTHIHLHMNKQCWKL